MDRIVYAVIILMKGWSSPTIDRTGFPELTVHFEEDGCILIGNREGLRGGQAEQKLLADVWTIGGGPTWYPKLSGPIRFLTTYVHTWCPARRCWDSGFRTSKNWSIVRSEGARCDNRETVGFEKISVFPETYCFNFRLTMDPSVTIIGTLLA